MRGGLVVVVYHHRLLCRGDPYPFSATNTDDLGYYADTVGDLRVK